MRINKLHLAGLAAALLGAGANGAAAEDVTISTSSTTPITTSNPEPNPPAGAGNVTIAAGGSITVTAGQAAVTLDSNNTVTNSGTLGSNNANTSTGILVTGGPTGTINSTSAISLLEDYTLADTNNDGDLDGGFASTTSTGRNGILVDAGGLIGDITSNHITVEGNDSAGIRLNGLLTGDLTSTGTIAISGDNSHGVLIDGGAGAGVDGDVTIRGSMTVLGTGSTGVTVNAPIINGGLNINGTWVVSGFHSLVRPTDVSNLEAEDTLNGGPAIAVRFSVAEGVTIQGIGVEDDADDDGDTIVDANDPNDNLTASIRSVGSSPAILIDADPSASLVLGPTGAGGFGLLIRGGVFSDGIYDGFDATAVRLEGSGAATVTTSGGIANHNVVAVTAREAEAYGIYVGQGATAPTLENRQIISAASTSETDQTAYAVFVATGGSMTTLDNSGLVRAQLFGEIGDAVAVFDQSGTITTINNTGSILAQTIATDADPSDDVVPVATGESVAINVAAAVSGVTINQVAATPFTDDDTADGDSASRPGVLIEGDILLGAFADTINLSSGSILGDIAFNGGADVFNITNGALYRGVISDSAGGVTLNVANGTLDLRGGQVTISGATFGADSTLGVLLSNAPADSTLITATGMVTFAPGASITAQVPAGLPTSDTIPFLLANGGLTGGSNVTGPVIGDGTSYLYNLAVVLGTPAAPDGAANSLALQFSIKTPTQLGMSENEAAAFDPILAALRRVDDAEEAFAALDNEFDFFDAYEDLLPSFSSAATELAATAIQQMQGATSNRLSATRLHDLDEVSVWAQEIAYGLNREPPTSQGQEFRGHGFGLAAGIDGPLNNGGLFGLSASFLTSEMEEPGRPEGEVSVSFGQVNAYYGTAVGAFDLDFIGGLGAGRNSSRRFVEIGDTFEALSEADWWSFEGHGAVRASMPLSLSNWMVVTPQVALTYVGMSEQGYTEEGGGDAVDYEVGDSFSQRLWGDAGVEFSGRLRMRGEAILAPRLFVGYRANLIDEEAERDFRFVSGGPEFTLVDEGYGDGGALVGIGIDATNGYSTFTLGYEGEFGDQIERHSLNASIRFRF